MESTTYPRMSALKTIIVVMLLLSLVAISRIESLAAATPPTDLTEYSLEELMNIPVYGASKYEQKQAEAPADVTIVTRDEIKKYGHRTLADILRSVRGFYVTYDRNYSYLGVRGFNRPGDYNMRILFLVDGHRLNDNIYDCVLIGTDFPVDLDLIDRVEIIRGPGSSLYGTSAFFAVINVITRRGRDLKGVELSGEAGSFNTYKGRLSYGNKFDRGPELLVSGSYYDSQGPSPFFRAFDSPATNHGIARDCDYDRFLSFFSKLSFKDFTLTGAYHSREKGIPTGAWGTVFNDPRNRTNDMRAYLDLKYEHTFANQLGFMARLYYDRYYYTGDYLYPNFVLNKDLGRGEWWGCEVQVSKKLFDRHHLIVGMEYRDNFRQDQINFDESPFFKYLDDRRHSKIWAFYIQDEFSILKNLRLNVGVRHDRYETFGGSTNPRLALIYMPFNQTVIKLLYGEGFRAPNFYELYWLQAGIVKPNPSLRPERIKTYELVWEQYLGNHYHLVASGYYYKIRDLIGQQADPDGLLVYRNSEGVSAKGVELELRGKWAGGLEGRISYTLQEAKDAQTGKLLSNSPKHLPKFNLIVPLFKDKLFSGIEVQYLSKRKTINNSHVGDAVITNLTLFNRNLFKNLELSASVYNLFNQKFRDPGGEEHLMNGMSGIIQDGITFRLKLSYSF